MHWLGSCVSHGASMRRAFHDWSRRHMTGGTQPKPFSMNTSRRSGNFENAPFTTMLMSCASAMLGYVARCSKYVRGNPAPVGLLIAAYGGKRCIPTAISLRTQASQIGWKYSWPQASEGDGVGRMTWTNCG